MTNEELKILASHVLIELDDYECQKINKHWDLISSQLVIIKKIKNLDNVKPMNYPGDLANKFSSMREDCGTNVSQRQDLLKNSKFHDEVYFKINGVIKNEK